MSFLTKLLAPKQTAGRLPELETADTRLITDRNYWKERAEAAEHDLQCERDSLARVVKRNRQIAESLSAASTELRFTQEALTAARAEAEANKADAEAHRRSKANLKQFRKADAKPILPEGLREQDGVIGFDCVSCDRFTEWHGDDVASFVDGASENRCGGSPRCIP